MRDMHSVISRTVLLANATYSADSTPVAVDLQGYDAVEVLLDIGVGGITFSGSNKIEFVLTHSDDNSSYSNVTDADMIGVTGISSGIIKSLIAAHAAGAVYRYGYRGNKRYLKLLADFSGTHGAGTPLAASALLMRPEYSPTANQA